MIVRATKTFGAPVRYRAGQILDLDERRAAELMAKGLVVAVPQVVITASPAPPAPPIEAPENKQIIPPETKASKSKKRKH